MGIDYGGFDNLSCKDCRYFIEGGDMPNFGLCTAVLDSLFQPTISAKSGFCLSHLSKERAKAKLLRLWGEEDV